MVCRRYYGFILALLLTVGLSACVSPHLTSDSIFPEDNGFQIDEESQIMDSAEARQVLDVLYHYRQALIAKDFGTLNRLISEDYYDNAGTTHTTADDYGREELAEIFEMMAQYAESIQYRVLIKDVVIKGERAHIDYEFDFSYQYRVGDEVTWDAGVDVNRLQLAREQDHWRITSGL
ncbi:MAG: hypothetical protein ACNA8W_01030 [Bradymonadaceae bacterium]